MPGFNAKELEINIEDRRLTILGKRETHEERKDKKTVYSEYCSDQVLRVVDLPGDVRAELAKANLKDGILEVELPKATPRTFPLQPKLLDSEERETIGVWSSVRARIQSLDYGPSPLLKNELP